uniref:Uncharacterized protein n=1 Tax=Rhizophora mucronata TaxID=61149 RepID=A0A2P2PY79_RHIMU
MPSNTSYFCFKKKNKKDKSI